ncbi:hypothetical protein PAALTS15_00020 [Paenibacillus alvei TS-15]|uniref:Uncharacterized protein n=1 Tax=Paenibacillus alvei TS-15 TaxID=1117108 RepID=S9U3S8_PAEAL|nr:hypothetical protein [Paenibacillus alvei]EPY09231.1 hypothetical protein PAALTS15_00020 [Paenibacillus alvei TS-15]
MGVNTKYRRKIVRLNKVFYWYVTPDFEDEGNIKLHILSEDKKFIVAYEVGQNSRPNKNPFIVIMGKEFVGLNNEYTGYRRALTPLWEDDLITPGLVGKIIDWCYSTEKELTLVDWQGELLR